MIKDFSFMREICVSNFLTFLHLFTNIEYGNADPKIMIHFVVLTKIMKNVVQ